MRHAPDPLIVARPVTVFADAFAAGFIEGPHSHERSEFIYAANGLLCVTTDHHIHAVPAGYAIWLPGGLAHLCDCRTDARLVVAHVEPAADRGTGQARVFRPSPLVRALIDEILTFPAAYSQAGREGRLVSVWLDELLRLDDLGFHVGLPRDPRIAAVCDAIRADCGDRGDIDEWADRSRMARRTFTRVFRAETGLGLAEWRHSIRLMEALRCLHDGLSVAEVAAVIGYDNASAFTAAFTRTLGAPPTQFMKR